MEQRTPKYSHPMTSMNQILTHADLQSLTGYRRQADVEACLRRQGIRFFRGRTGIWTTMAALNHLLGVPQVDRPDEPYRPDQVF